MMRYSSEDEKELQELLDKRDWRTCLICFFYTHNPEHDQYRCHCGSCPAIEKWK